MKKHSDNSIRAPGGQGGLGFEIYSSNKSDRERNELENPRR